MGNTATEWSFVQSREEFASNSKVVDDWLAEKGWKLSEVPAERQLNGNAVVGYMTTHFLVDGKKNATPANIKTAIAESHRAGRIFWADGHAPKKLTHERSALREADPLGLESRAKSIKFSEIQKDHTAAQNLFNYLKKWAANYQSSTNAKSYRIREKLTAMLSVVSISGWTLKQVEDLQQKLQVAATTDVINPLPIDANLAEMRAASPEQLADLIRRQAAAKAKK